MCIDIQEPLLQNEDKHGGSSGLLPQPEMRSHARLHTQGSVLEDIRSFAPGSVPHSAVVGVVVGVGCGVSAWLYYVCLFWLLDFFWHDVPDMLVKDSWPEWSYIFWIPIVGFTMALGVGLTVRYMGEPGDLASTIKNVHEDGYVHMNHVMPMVCASQFSIIGGGSLGPEAPLVAICAAVGGFISQNVFKMTEVNLVRKHTLMGMSAALAAFFGCPLGGSLFALEVNSHFGVEYFEHAIEAIFAGEICLVVFRSLAGLSIASIWRITTPLTETSNVDVMYGFLLGVIGAGVAICFAHFHWKVMALFGRFNLLKPENAVPRALCGAVMVVALGILIPATMFWGEYEFQTISTMSPSSTLEHIWPTTTPTHFEMNSFGTALLLGCAKLVAISFTVAGGYRGGFIFPLMATGAALGRAIHFIMPFIPVQLCCLCMAAAINVGITRTAVATTLILAFLSGEQYSIAPLVASSFVSLFLTAYTPFIKSQVLRSDIELLLENQEQRSVSTQSSDLDV